MNFSTLGSKTIAKWVGILLGSAMYLDSHAAPISPPEEGSTYEQVRAAVDHYFETKPKLRPVEHWRELYPRPTCSNPGYPRAGFREKMMGTTVLSFEIGDEGGHAMNVHLQKSSGWALLDEAAFVALDTCVFVPDTPGTKTVSYIFGEQ